MEKTCPVITQAGLSLGSKTPGVPKADMCQDPGVAHSTPTKEAGLPSEEFLWT